MSGIDLSRKEGRAAAVAPPIPVRRRRGAGMIAVQVLVLAAAAGAFIWLAHNAAVNLAARHIASGFGFLGDTAGFSISEGWVPYTSRSSYAVAFAAGIANTLRAALPAVVLASLIGLVLGIGQISRHPLVRLITRGVVDLIRNIPLLVQLLVWYVAMLELLPRAADALNLGNILLLSNGGLAFAKPLMTAPEAGVLIVSMLVLFAAALLARGHRTVALAAAAVVSVALWLYIPDHWDVPVVGLFGINGGGTVSVEWASLVGALTLYSGVYCAEIVRSGLLAVHRGQWEAAHALSLTRGQTLRRIVIPQSLRVIVPPYTSLVMNTLKNSSLAVAVGYPDIVSIGTTSLNQTGQAIECIAIIAAVYLSLNILTAAVMGTVNRRVQLQER